MFLSQVGFNCKSFCLYLICSTLSEICWVWKCDLRYVNWFNEVNTRSYSQLVLRISGTELIITQQFYILIAYLCSVGVLWLVMNMKLRYFLLERSDTLSEWLDTLSSDMLLPNRLLLDKLDSCYCYSEYPLDRQIELFFFSHLCCTINYSRKFDVNWADAGDDESYKRRKSYTCFSRSNWSSRWSGCGYIGTIGWGWGTAWRYWGGYCGWTNCRSLDRIGRQCANWISCWATCWTVSSGIKRRTWCCNCCGIGRRFCGARWAGGISLLGSTWRCRHRVRHGCRSRCCQHGLWKFYGKNNRFFPILIVCLYCLKYWIK